MDQATRWRLPRLSTLVRSAGVGTVVTVVDLALLALLVGAAGVSARVASPIALAVGVAIQFFGNKLIAFRDPSPRWARQVPAFLAVEGLGFVANATLFDVASRHVPVPYVIVRLVTTSVVYFTICLPLWSRIFAAPIAREAT